MKIINVVKLERKWKQAVFIQFLAKNSKKNEKSWGNGLAKVPANAIIGLTPAREPRAREVRGEIEGIGDVLSDGPR